MFFALAIYIMIYDLCTFFPASLSPHSNPESLIMQQDQNERPLPSHTYSVLSRGNPAHTTSLTHQQLQEAHAKHYHPSNAMFLVRFNHFIFFHCLSLKSFGQFPCLSQFFESLNIKQDTLYYTTGNNLSRFSNVMQIQPFQSLLVIRNGR